MAIKSSLPEGLLACLDRIPLERENIRLVASEIWASLDSAQRQAVADLGEPAYQRWCRISCASPFARRLLQRHPPWLVSLVRQESPLFETEYSGETEFLSALREYRNRKMLEIIWQDLDGPEMLERTMKALTCLAEDTLRWTLSQAESIFEHRHGPPCNAQGERVPFTILGMGKLGGGELNLSSDIDLVFVYGEGGETCGSFPEDNAEYFHRLGQWIIRALSQPGPEGFVFRVDMRLRPFGDAGPLCISAPAIEQYYGTHGRTWERYALVKARPVAGDLDFGHSLLRQLRPFIYRRYLDFTALDGIREIRALMDAEQGAASLDIKKGRGGIREIEFICQSLQLIHGGRRPGIQATGTLAALESLTGEGLLDKEETAFLENVYRFWRRVEHALQMVEDRQTQTLPQTEEGWQRLACILGEDSTAAMRERIQSLRAEIHRRFWTLLGRPEGAGSGTPEEMAWQAAQNALEESPPAGWDKIASFRDPQAAWQWLRDFAKSRKVAIQLSVQGRARLDALIPRVLGLCRKFQPPETGLATFLELTGALLASSHYLALLSENPGYLQECARLLQSPWLARELSRFPMILEDVLLHKPTHRSGWPGELSASIAEEDLETRMDGLRRFKNSKLVQIAAGYWAGQRPLDRLLPDLSSLAAFCIRQALPWAVETMERQHGPAPGTPPGRIPFAVIAYGKLGGREMGLASDLDLVFLYDADADATSRGRIPLDTAAWFARLGQRLIHILGTLTRAGILYEIDMRLRPSGQNGPLVAARSAFWRYQRESAWVWEHQALTRARWIAGDPGLGEQFESLRAEILGRPQDLNHLVVEIRGMRRRIRENSRIPEGHFHLKLSPGGLVDIEFLVQSAILAHSAQVPELLRQTGTLPGILTLAGRGIWDRQTAQAVQEAWLQLRDQENRRWLQLQAPSIPGDDPQMDALMAAAQSIREIWRRQLGPVP